MRPLFWLCAALLASCSLVVDKKLEEKSSEEERADLTDGEPSMPGGDAAVGQAAAADGSLSMPNADAGSSAPSDKAKLCAGVRHACALHSSGKVRCWGRNVEGETTLGGDATLFRDIACGAYHTCGITTQGAVTCVGRNQKGQRSDAPTGTGFVQITAGDEHSCARKETGAICWGSDELGQAPNAELSGLKLHGIAAGEQFTCGILEDRSVKCWGSSAGMRTRAPVVKDAVSIAAGGGQACIIDARSVVRCWGEDSTNVQNLSAAVEITVAGSDRESRGCARLQRGEVFCWRGGGPVEEPMGPYAAVGVGPSVLCTLPAGKAPVCTADEDADLDVELLETGAPRPWPPL